MEWPSGTYSMYSLHANTTLYCGCPNTRSSRAYIVHKVLDCTLFWPLNYPRYCTSVDTVCLVSWRGSRLSLYLQLSLQSGFYFVIHMSPLALNTEVGTGAS